MHSQFYDALLAQPISEPPKDAIWVDDGSASTYLAGPAFFDPQVNGFAGVDFQDPNITCVGLEHAARELQKAGCSQFLLTLITASKDFLAEQFARIAGWVDESELLLNAIPGFHLEGPFLSPEKGYVGAHPTEHVLEPSWELFETLQQAARGKIKLTTVAAEAPGCIQFIRKVSDSGVMVSIGHSNASMEDLYQAVNAGARMFTHLTNGCPPEMHRHNNIIQRVLSFPDLLVSLIPDGIHVPPPVLSNLAHSLGVNRVVMISDAMSAAGSEPGRYKFGHLELEIGEDRIVRLPGTNQYAGSSLTPLQGFYNCIRFGGLSANQAWHTWTWLRRRMFVDLEVPTLVAPFGK